MKNPVQLAALAWWLSILTAFAQGSLTPPGAPGSTMKTLSQVEPRTPISSLPFIITQPGSYYLTTNVNTSVSNAITIAVNGVSLDLSGFTISSSTANAANGGSAILINSGLRNISIANGFIQGGVTNNGSGVYSGSGFGYGIYYSGIAPANVLMLRVSISGCLYHGIYLNSLDSTVAESCTVRTVGSYGISAGTVKESSALDCGESGIFGFVVSDCNGQSSGSGYGVFGSQTVLNCYGSSSSGDGISCNLAENSSGYGGGFGIGVAADSALNCYGFSGSGDGVSTTSAQNCYGYSANSYGINSNTAHDCYGDTISGTGVGGSIAVSCYGTSNNGNAVSVNNAESCYGYSSGNGYGIIALTAVNCIGYCNGSGTGIDASYIGNSCYGYSYSGTGVFAFIANSCHGSTTIGTPLSTSHNVNSF